MKWGVAINLRETVSEIVEKAVFADRGGMDSVWITDYPAVRLSPVVASIVAQETERIRIGVGLLSPFIYPSVQIVQFMSTLINHYGHRFDLLIGPGDKTRLADIGIELGKGVFPVRKIAESLANIQDSFLDQKDCHIFLAAQGKKMIETSTSSDGVILNYSDLEMIKWAIARLGDIPDSFEIGVFPPTLIVDSEQQNDPYSIRASAGIVALGMTPSMIRRFGLNESLDSAGSLLKEKGKVDEDVINLIDRSVTDRFCICGDKKSVCNRVRLLQDLGVRTVVFGPPQGATLEGVKQIVQAKKACK
jgi:alkanesulfonate monooxygenase SsuD/methylene tetrahydromethanopterin reductase-like flavin-dependent oxidoreductase (luciferase family)